MEIHARSQALRTLNFKSHFNASRNKEAEKYIEFLKDKLKIKKEQVVPFYNDFLPELIKRAVKKQPPIKHDDKGFRDATIWLSLKEYCKKAYEKQIIFISNNFNDFGIKGTPNSLNEDLLKECDNENITINYYNSISDFIEKHSVKIEYITESWITNNFDDQWFDDVLHITFMENNLKVHGWIEKHLKHGIDNFRIISTNPYQYGHLSIYELQDDTIIVNITINAEIEIEYEFTDYSDYPEPIWQILTSTRTFDLEGYFTLTIKDAKIEHVYLEDWY